MQRFQEDIALKNEDMNKELKSHIESVRTEGMDSTILKTKMNNEGLTINDFAKHLDQKDDEIKDLFRINQKLENDIKNNQNQIKDLTDFIESQNNQIEEFKKE